MARFSTIKALLLLLVLTSGFAAEARRRKVPLMPPRSHHHVAYQRGTWSPGGTYHTEQRQRRDYPVRLGLEVGLLGRNNTSEGIQTMKGGRLVMDLNLTDRWHFRPSFGYFTRSEGEKDSNVTEHNFEFGAGALYDLTPNRAVHLLAGGVARIDALTSSITILKSEDSVPLTFRFRAGPHVGLLIDPSSVIKFTLGFELPVELPDLRFFGSATAGVLFAF